MQIRPERPDDYAAIAAMHLRAFDDRFVPPIVAFQRQRAGFDPDLSLVAEVDGRVVGHVLFMPEVAQVLGQPVRAVNLSPVGVEPGLQRSGIGGRMIEAGHAVAREKGYALSIVLGHHTYYPRFGYLTGVYGDFGISVQVDHTSAAQLISRPPLEEDLQALQALWLHEERDVDLSLQRGPQLLDWLSPNPQIAALVWLRDEQVVGYTRVHAAEPASPRAFLAADHGAARSVAAALAQAAGSDVLRLPLHQRSASAAAFGPAEGSAWDAGMALSLLPNPFDDFYAVLQAGERAPGRIIWPASFDLG